MNKIINATRKDKKRIVSILVSAFDQDPQINLIVGFGKNRQNRLKSLMSFAFEYAYVNGTIHLTENKESVALWKKPNINKSSFWLTFASVIFSLLYGKERMGNIATMERKIEDNYPDDLNYRYLWFLGTSLDSQGKGFASTLLSLAVENSLEDNQPIYLETSTQRNVSYYRKKGFEVYHEILLNMNKPVTIYCMKTISENYNSLNTLRVYG